jgi:hypothetical protein
MTIVEVFVPFNSEEVALHLCEGERESYCIDFSTRRGSKDQQIRLNKFDFGTLYQPPSSERKSSYFDRRTRFFTQPRSNSAKADLNQHESFSRGILWVVDSGLTIPLRKAELSMSRDYTVADRCAVAR